MVDPSINEHEEGFDRAQLYALAGLMLVGALFVFSATMANPVLAGLPWFDQMWARQIVWYALGIVAGVTLCFIEYHALARWAIVAYWTAICFLVMVLIPHIGSMKLGARRWIDFGPFQFQPSEFAKLAFILALANFLSRPSDELKLPVNFWKAMGLMLLPFALIFKEPDLGSALVLLPTGLVMMFVAGIPRQYLLRLAGGAGLLGALFVGDILFAPAALQIPMQSYQRDRLLVYFGGDFTRFAPSNATAAELERARHQQLDINTMFVRR